MQIATNKFKVDKFEDYYDSIKDPRVESCCVIEKAMVDDETSLRVRRVQSSTMIFCIHQIRNNSSRFSHNETIVINYWHIALWI